MRTIIRATAMAFALTLVAGWVLPAEAQSLKIGVFDPARVSEEAEDAKNLQTELSSMRDSRQASITAEEQVVNEMRQRLQQQALSLSPDKRATMEIEIQRKMIALNSLKETANQELQLEFAAAEARFNDKLRQVVDQYARDQKFDLILDANAIAWASVAIDVTTPIVDQYNRMFPGTPAANTTP